MDMNPVSDQTTGDERLLLLAAALDTRVGLTFDQIASTGLLGNPDALLPDSLRRTFLVCRGQLEQIGIRVVETRYGGETRYKIDAHLTYADPQDIELTRDEALSLVTLLSVYLDDVGDAGSPFAADARKARDKIASVAGLSYWRADGDGRDGEGGGTRAAPRPSGRTRRRGALERAATAKASEKLLAAYTEQHPVTFLYTDALGVAAPHRLEVFGMFERHGMTYLVGRDRKGAEGQGSEGQTPEEQGPERQKDAGPVKVFRTDRIDARSVKVDAARTYSIPADFSVDDYMLLPFQYGAEEDFRATFQAPAGARPDDFGALTMGKGTWRCAEVDGAGCGERWLWSVEANDLEGLARWSVGALACGLAPVAPPELAAALASGLAKTEEAHA